MAFQPIVDSVPVRFSLQEALVRGEQRTAAEVFAQVNDDNLYRFDQVCRVRAIKLAADLGVSAFLTVNFMPNAVYRPELCIRTALEAAQTFGFPTDRIIFEITEGERVNDLAHLRSIVTDYQQRGFQVAIDDFRRGLCRPEFVGRLEDGFCEAGHGIDPRHRSRQDTTDNLPRDRSGLPGTRHQKSSPKGSRHATNCGVLKIPGRQPVSGLSLRCRRSRVSHRSIRLSDLTGVPRDRSPANPCSGP